MLSGEGTTAFRGLSLATQASAGPRQPLREDTVPQSDQILLLAPAGQGHQMGLLIPLSIPACCGTEASEFVLCWTLSLNDNVDEEC